MCCRFGVVYRAELHGTSVAAKFVRNVTEKGREEFLKEVTFLQKLRHPNTVLYMGGKSSFSKSAKWNILNCFTACLDFSHKCIITEYAEGGSLGGYLHSNHKSGMPLQEVIAVSLDIARGMAYLHSQKI